MHRIPGRKNISLEMAMGGVKYKHRLGSRSRDTAHRIPFYAFPAHSECFGFLLLRPGHRAVFIQRNPTMSPGPIVDTETARRPNPLTTDNASSPVASSRGR